MNKKIEERAEIYQREMSLLDEGQTKFDDVDLGSVRYVAFKAGVEWVLEQLSIIKCPSKSMPENEEGKEIEEDSYILATTSDCIIFYGDGKFDYAYREWTKGNGWRWKIKYGPNVDDNKVLFWMWSN